MSTSHVRPHALIIAAVITVALALPATVSAQAQAQAQARAAADPPSRSVETLRQHDSLVVHFARRPKAKAAGTTAATRQSKKAAAAIEAASARVRVETPLVRRGAAKDRQ